MRPLSHTAPAGSRINAAMSRLPEKDGIFEYNITYNGSISGTAAGVKVRQYDRISHGDAPKVPLRYLHGAVTAKIYKYKAPYRYFEVILICQDRINASGAVPIKRCAKAFEGPRPWVKGS